MFSDDFETDSFRANAFYAYDDFFTLGTRVGISEVTIKKELQQFIEQEIAVSDLVQQSFLTEDSKALYLTKYQNKIKRLRYSFNGSA